MIFGEADLFPGLTVDRFESVLVTQTLSLGMERIQARLLPILVQVLRADGQDIAGVYLRNDAALREKEGLAQGKGWFPLPDEPEPALTGADIVENGIRYRVDFINGQKTGFFWIRNITGRRWRGWPRGGRCWTASPTPAPSPSTRPKAAQSM